MKNYVVYIASPYTVGDKEYNVQQQVIAAHTLLDKGYVPYAPLLSHYLEKYKARPYREWLDACLTIVERCDAVLRLPGESQGADEEVKLATRLGRPVYFSVNSLEVGYAHKLAVCDLPTALLDARSSLIEARMEMTRLMNENQRLHLSLIKSSKA